MKHRGESEANNLNRDELPAAKKGDFEWEKRRPRRRGKVKERREKGGRERTAVIAVTPEMASPPDCKE